MGVTTFALACGDQPGPVTAAAADRESTPLVIPPMDADASAPIAADPPSTSEPADTRATMLIPARDPRMAKRRPRSRALVLTEVSSLERLLASTQANAPDRPVLRRRIAESYNELAATSSGPDAARARDESIKQYTAIRNDHPTYAQIDEVLYYLALAHELNGDKVNARRTYYELITKAPSSKLIPLAYFAFGEMFFTEAATDPAKNDLAKAAFTEVIKYPAASNPIYPDTLLRLGQTYLRQKEDAKAKTMFDNLQRDFPDSSAASQAPHVP